MSIFNGSASDIEDNRNKVSIIDKNSTNKQYPSAKAVYDAMQSASIGYSFVSNALKNSASGEVVAIKDVSPLPHSVTLKASGDVVADKDLAAKESITFAPISNWVITTSAMLEYLKFTFEDTSNKYTPMSPAELGIGAQYLKVECVNGVCTFFYYDDKEMTSLQRTETTGMSSPLVSVSTDDAIHIKVVKAVGGEETLTKTVEVTEKMQTVPLDNPASSVRVVVEGGCNCVGGLVPMVDGDDLTASEVREQVVLWPPWSYGEANGSYDLEYTISGNTLSWSGTKYNVVGDVIEQSKDISGFVELSTVGQKIIGFCQVYGLDEDNPYFKHDERDKLNMTVKVYESASQVNVKVCGKNILPKYVSESGVAHAGVTFTTDENGIVTLNGTCELESGLKDFVLARDWQLPAGDYYLSGCPDGGAVYKYYLFATIKSKGGKEYYQWDTGNGVGISIGTGDIIKLLSVRIGYKLNGVTVTNMKFRPMLTCGTSASEFEPRIETTKYTVDVNKETLVPSRYPSMTFIPDNEDVTLSVEYNRDINKAFAELQAAIISMGGNV